MDKIMERLKSDYNYVSSLGYEVVGVFLQGSQNYELDYENSDIDTKAVVLPSMEDIILNKKPVSTTLILDSNEHIDIKDMRLMFECFKKQNINFLEILFTKYKYINPIYKEEMDILVANNESIARYNNYAAIKSMVGVVLEKYAALEHPYPSIVDKIEKYGYDPKQLHHLLRVNEFIYRYLDGELYKDCLISKQSKYLINVKRSNFYSLDEARSISKLIVDALKDLKNNYMENNLLVINESVNNLLSSILLKVFKKNFYKDFQRELE